MITSVFNLQLCNIWTIHSIEQRARAAHSTWSWAIPYQVYGAFPIRFMGHSLPSSEIEKEKLRDPSAVVAKHPKFRCESQIATLAVKLAKDAYFGVKILSKCTVMGERELPGLPRAELSELKKLLFLQFPNFWHSKQQFEPNWKLCIDAVGQLCKCERCKAVLRDWVLQLYCTNSLRSYRCNFQYYFNFVASFTTRVLSILLCPPVSSLQNKWSGRILKFSRLI